METKLWDKQWFSLFKAAAGCARQELLIVSPFIQAKVLRELLPKSVLPIRVITRFSLRDFSEGVSDIEALACLLDRGAVIKGVRNLHAKAYLFDDVEALVTSANLTYAGLTRNHEFGISTKNAELIQATRLYFEGLWARAGATLEKTQLETWRAEIAERQRNTPKGQGSPKFPDHGADLGFKADERPTMQVGGRLVDAPQWFVKFFGESDNRASPEKLVIDEVERSGSHWACTYPKNKRPRQVQDEAVMFMGRLVDGPDISVFGYAIGSAYHKGADDATEADIAQRPWKKKWPHYIRVHDPEFVKGVLGNGISLNELMRALGHRAFASTARNHTAGKGDNTDPRRAYLQKASVELTGEGAQWLITRLEAAFRLHGQLTEKDFNYP